MILIDVTIEKENYRVRYKEHKSYKFNKNIVEMSFKIEMNGSPIKMTG